MKERVHLRAHFFPWNQFDLARVDLSNAPFDLLGPRSFDVFIRLSMKRLEEAAGQLCAIRFRKGGCLAKKLSHIACHRESLPR